VDDLIDHSDQTEHSQRPIRSHEDPSVPRELDVVELRDPVAQWPVGTVGTLVESYADGGIVEVDDNEGRTLDLIPVPYAAMTLRKPGTHERAGELGEDRQVGV
jgi:hypothetical protein